MPYYKKLKIIYVLREYIKLIIIFFLHCLLLSPNNVKYEITRVKFFSALFLAVWRIACVSFFYVHLGY